MTSTPSTIRRSSVPARSGTSKQTWWKPSPREARKRATPGRLVGRLDELDLALADRQESDRDAVTGDGQDRLDREGQNVAVEAQRGLQVAHHDRHVVDPPEPVLVGERSGARRHAAHPPTLADGVARGKGRAVGRFSCR